MELCVHVIQKAYGAWKETCFWVTEASGSETMESILGLTLGSSRFRAHLYEACLGKRGIWPKKSICLYSKCDGGGSRGLPRYKNIIGKPHYSYYISNRIASIYMFCKAELGSKSEN